MRLASDQRAPEGGRAAGAGIRPASIHDLYLAMGRGDASGFTVPAINVRAMSYDTARAVIRAAKKLNADLTRWSFLTGDRDEIDHFGARFGVSVARAMSDVGDITHNLRTAIIDADGKVVKVYTGNDWTPDQVLADLKALGSRP